MTYVPRRRRPKEVIAAEKKRKMQALGDGDLGSDMDGDEASMLLGQEGELNQGKPKKKKEETDEERQAKVLWRAARKEHEKAAKARLKEERDAAKTAKKASEKVKSAPPASIIEFMDMNGEMRSINAATKTGATGRTEMAMRGRLRP